uniref:Uncharacterized protein n=2 Tax=Avena sativa TaxID=4498 RepID=A0ACD5TRX7_AVESA
MATVLEGLVSSSLRKLGKLVEDEVVMTLSVGRDIKRLKQNLEGFRAVRRDAEAVAMRDEMVNLWWKRISDVMFNVDDVIDLYMVHSNMRHRSPPCCSLFSCFTKLLDDHRVGTRIKSINVELDDISRTISMYTPGRPRSPQQQIRTADLDTDHMGEPGVVGTAITHDVDSMVQAIVYGVSENNEPSVFGIGGMGGIGKTTLAQKIFCDQRIKGVYQIHIWLYISETFIATGLLKRAIRMAGGNCDQLEHVELVVRLKQTIEGKSVFLVLDDVPNPDVWNNLLRSPLYGALDAASNACILVTTRNRDILQAMDATHTHQVNTMSEDDGLRLLMKNAFQPYDGTFQELGRAIVERCDGLPLAIKVVAGVLSTKRTVVEWEMVRDSEWYVEGLPPGVEGSLYVSYRNLPDELKQCFLWCALLPPNFGINRDAVSYWWVAEGFVRKERGRSIYKTAEGYYYELIKRNLLQPKPEFVNQGVSTMHDVLRSLGQHLTKDYSLYMKVKNDLSMFMNDEDNAARPNLRRLGIGTDVEELPALEEHECLRTLLVFYNQNFRSVRGDIFRRLQHIRVVILSGTSIQNIPESVGNLVLLKLLDLSHTEITELPESIGRLISLEYLCLRGCHKLYRLPASLMRLWNISFLELEDTALRHVPKGIEKFKKLYNLRGVFESETGFRLDELQCLPNIHRLWVTKLEQAIPGGHKVLENSNHLIELGLRCTMGVSTNDRTLYADDKVQIIQEVYDKLKPSRSLEYIFIVGFPGTAFPEWLCLEPELTMPHLGHMHLNECISCSKLPPAGQMPELQVLQVKGADAVETIGTELLGRGVRRPGRPAVFFPELELLLIIGMCKLQSWSLDLGNPCDIMGDNFKEYLMPKLQRLLLVDCPRLSALPANLFMNLKRIHIEGAHELQEVVDLPAVVWLKVKNNTWLRKIANLGNLRDLFAQDCPALDQANNLWSLRRVYMIDCAHAQEFEDCLAEEALADHRRDHPGPWPSLLRKLAQHVAHTAKVGHQFVADTALFMARSSSSLTVRPRIQFHLATDGRNIFPDETLYNQTGLL